MKLPSSVRKRVQRNVDEFLRGAVREDAVVSVLADLRDFAGNHKLFMELSNFVAHAGNRSRGIVYDHIEHFACGVKCMIFAHESRVVDLSGEIPLEFGSYIYGRLKRIPEVEVLGLVGKSRSMAEKILKRFLVRKSGSWRIVSSNEAKSSKEDREIAITLCQELCKTIEAKPVFHEDVLREDFTATLLDHGFLNHHGELDTVFPLIVLTIMARLHQRRYSIDGYDDSRTMINVHEIGTAIKPATFRQTPLVLSIAAYVGPLGRKQLTVAFDLFETTLNAWNYVEEHLLSCRLNGTHNGIDYFIPDFDPSADVELVGDRLQRIN